MLREESEGAKRVDGPETMSLERDGAAVASLLKPRCERIGGSIGLCEGRGLVVEVRHQRRCLFLWKSGSEECFKVGEGCRFGYNEKIEREDGDKSEGIGKSSHWRGCSEILSVKYE